MARRKAYWVYVHDWEQDEQLEDLGEFDNLTQALVAVGLYLEADLPTEVQGHATIHVVNNATLETIWKAGPVRLLGQPAPEGFTFM